MQKWEYKSIEQIYIEEHNHLDMLTLKEAKEFWRGEGWYWIDDYSITMRAIERLSRFGEEGWECFSVVNSGYYSENNMYYFKRPLPD